MTNHELVSQIVNENDLSSVICDADDVKDRIRAYGIENKPKDSEGSETTISDCIIEIINFLQQLENAEINGGSQ